MTDLHQVLVASDRVKRSTSALRSHLRNGEIAQAARATEDLQAAVEDLVAQLARVNRRS